MVDSLNLVLLELAINVNLIPLSTIVCKVYQSLMRILPAYSAWILVFISAERYILVMYSRSKLAKIFDHKWFQLTVLFLIAIFCFFYYSLNWLFFKVTHAVFYNDSIEYYDSVVENSITACYIDDDIFKIASYMDIFFSTLIPFIALITSSFLIIYSMTTLRRRISQTSSALYKKREKRDYQFARTILLLDFIFILFYSPYQFFIVASNYFVVHWNSGLRKDIGTGFLYLYYIGPAVNFLVYMMFNLNFRSEFLKIIENSSFAL